MSRSHGACLMAFMLVFFVQSQAFAGHILVTGELWLCTSEIKVLAFPLKGCDVYPS